MRAYLVTGGGRRRYGATQADSKAKRDEIVEATGVKKSEVSIEEAEVPMDKPSLLEFINGLCAELDERTAESIPAVDKGSPEKDPEDEEPQPEPEKPARAKAKGKAAKKKGRR